MADCPPVLHPESRIPNPAPRFAQSAFSLVELLVVIGIIALLVGIIMPSVGSARTEAKRSTVKQLLASLDRGLETFSTDLRQYPDSKVRVDPLKIDGDSGPVSLNGAHWLARAVVGHDGAGLDFGGRTLQNVSAPIYDLTDNVNNVKNPFLPGGACAQRRGTYIQKANVAPDTEIGVSGGPRTGRICLKDVFEFPILYYKANVRAQHAFSFTGQGTGAQGTRDDQLGIYNLLDNAAITGAYSANALPPTSYSRETLPLKLVNSSTNHGLGVFGNIRSPKDRTATVSDPVQGRYFVDLLSDPGALKTNTIKPVNDTTIVLISAGPDGLYGTPDDVTNFK